MKKLLRAFNIAYDNTLILIFIVIILITGYCVYDSYYLYTHAVDENIQIYKPSKNNTSYNIEDNLTENNTDSNIDKSPITDDMVAWITIYNTNIDFPIMQSTDNITYLNTNPYGNYSLAGSIFLDFRNDSNFNDAYSIIYGHNMEYGKMFGNLDKFFDESYILSHRTGELIIGKNADAVYSLKIFACMKSTDKNKSVFVPGESVTVLNELQNNAIILLDELDYNKRILVLSTCSSDYADERLLVFCYIE